MGHRLVTHESKCRSLHGHRYVAEITVEADSLDHCGRVVDFGCIKSLVGDYVDRELDHTVMLQHGDPLVAAYQAVVDEDSLRPIVRVMFPPTAENIAAMLWRVAEREFHEASVPVSVVRVRIHETPNCYADCLAAPVGDNWWEI